MDNEERQRAIHETVIRIDERQEALCSRVDEHVKQTDRRFAHLNQAVYGSNGSPGLKADVAVLRSDREGRRWIKPTLYGAGLSLVVALVVYLLTI